MPTKRPRLTITETPEIERRLDRAAAQLPELAGQRKALLLHLTELGEQALEQRQDATATSGAAKRRLLERVREISVVEGDAMLAAREAGWAGELDR